VRSTQQFSITLPDEMAEAVRSKVAAGEYATESEVIRDGLRRCSRVTVQWKAGCASRSRPPTMR
jgi:putative addiction module CopG family antidote